MQASSATDPPPLPASTAVVSLVGEGGANAVFAISVSERMPLDAVPIAELLRLPKASRPGAPPRPSYRDLQRYWQAEIRPLFCAPDASLVSQRLVSLPPGLQRACNLLLADADCRGDRRAKFISDRVCEAQTIGMLVQDMRPPLGSAAKMVEFKPKWLAQSPRAPPNAIRCRTCAVALRRLVQSPADDRAMRRLCPLRLLDPPPPPALIRSDQTAEQAVAESVEGRALMRELQTAQQRLDPPRSDRSDDAPSDSSLAKAMALRDCSCYVWLADGSLHCRLGDLDQKGGPASLAAWRSLDSVLIRDHFYTVRWMRIADALVACPSSCRIADVLTDTPTDIIDVVSDPAVAASTTSAGHAKVVCDSIDLLRQQLLALSPGCSLTAS